MQFIKHPISRFSKAFLLTAIIVCTCDSALAQRPATQTPDGDVLRTNTDLVQTTITVMDKKGKFIEGLGRDDFELLIDGKARPINFFERVSSGSDREADLSQRKQPQASVPSYATVRGRTIIFSSTISTFR